MVMLKRIAAITLSLLFVSLPLTAYDSEDQSRSITSPCNAHMAAISETAPHAYEKHFEWTSTPSAAKEFANKPLPNTAALIALAPVTAEDYQAIFGHGKNNQQGGVTEAQRKEIEAVQGTLKADFGADEGDRTFNKTDYKKALQAKNASFVIVVGHNENGMMRLLDGSLLYLDEVVAAARPEQRVILISCDSASHVSNSQVAGTIGGEVTYPEAFSIAQGIMKYIKDATGPVSLADVQAELTKQGVTTTHKVAFFIMKAVCAGAALIVVGLIIRELDPCKDKDSPCPDHSIPSGPADKQQKNLTGVGPAQTPALLPCLAMSAVNT
jgi:hypothetical protein